MKRYYYWILAFEASVHHNIMSGALAKKAKTIARQNPRLKLFVILFCRHCGEVGSLNINSYITKVRESL